MIICRHACLTIIVKVGTSENGEVWKWKYENGNTEVRRKATYQCLTPGTMCRGLIGKGSLSPSIVRVGCVISDCSEPCYHDVVVSFFRTPTQD